MAETIHISISRMRGLTRAILWSVPTVLSCAALVVIYRSVDLKPSGLTNRLVDVAVLLAALPVAAIALTTFVAMIYPLLLCCWPGGVTVEAEEETLVVKLGPYLNQRFEARELRIRYPFDLAEEDAGFEAFLPQETQMATMMPRITHSESAKRLDELIVRYAAMPESELAATLSPALRRWREMDPTLTLDEDEDD